MKKKWVKIAIIAAIALVAAAGLAALTIWVVIPAVNYSKADTLMAEGDYPAAFDAFDRLGDYRDAQARKGKVQQEVIGARASDTLEFGGYEWLVLEQRDNKALLLMKDILEKRPYNESNLQITWEGCTLRMWLNGQFYEAFSQADRARIVETTVVNSPNPQSGTAAGGDTKDHVFLLSLTEAKLYFASDATRAATNVDGTAAWWWLRSPGLEPFLAAIVGSEGAVGYAGSSVNYYDRGVRPAMWVTAE